MTQRQWTASTVIGTACALLGALVTVASGIWFYAGVSYAAQNIPRMQAALNAHSSRLATLEEAKNNQAVQYAEILAQINRLNDKLDRLNERGKP